MTCHLAFVVCLVLAMAFIAPAAWAADQDPIVVGSKIDTEGALLGQMILAMLESEGITVTGRTEFGPTPIVRKASPRARSTSTQSTPATARSSSRAAIRPYGKMPKPPTTRSNGSTTKRTDLSG